MYTEGFGVGGFVTAVLANDLVRAVQVADSVNTQFLPNIVAYMLSNVSPEMWGSYEIVAAHYKRMKDKKMAAASRKVRRVKKTRK